MEIRDYFIRGDMKGAIEYMRAHEEYSDILPAYESIFENCEYLNYDVPDSVNDVLRLYQIYFRDVFYCGMPEEDAVNKLLDQMRNLLTMPDADEDQLVGKLQTIFEENGLHAQFGDTQGYYGPYVWRETVPTTFSVELPDETAEYTVNILKGFIFRSWMDYLTFGQFGTGGWASKDGTINCVEQAYDFESDSFRISFLKHEAQHASDMKRFPGISAAQLEYRAKLVELAYFNDVSLLRKFLAEADEKREGDGHALASARLKREFADTDQSDVSAVKSRALELFRAHTAELLA